MKRQSGHYALKDLEELAREKTAELSALIGRDLELQWPPRGTRKGAYRDWEFSDWEIDCFLRAYREYSLFELRSAECEMAEWLSACGLRWRSDARQPSHSRRVRS